MNSFLDISGDTNPLHTDLNYAKSNGFDNKVVYGMMEVAFYSRLVGVYLPGKYCILQSVNASFHYPVFPGDRLFVSGKVTEKYNAVRSLEISAIIVNQSGKKASKAKIMVGCLR